MAAEVSLSPPATVEPAAPTQTECRLEQCHYLREWGTEDCDRIPLDSIKNRAVPDGFELVQEADVVGVRAKGIVGLVPIRCATPGCTRHHLLAVYPKGAPVAGKNEPEQLAALCRFVDLLLFAQGDRNELKNPDPAMFSGRRASERFWILFGLGFVNALDQLCRRDFRHYYRAESGERTSVRGRIDVVRHRLNIVRGRGRRIPCRWEEFTPNHLDNRLLQAARCHALRELRPALSDDWRRRMTRTAPYFTEVEKTQPTAADFRGAKLRRLSPFYREALDWAEWLLRGVQASDRTTAARNMPPLLFETDKLFENFVLQIVKDAARKHGRIDTPQKRLPLLRDAGMSVRPDAVIERRGDAPPIVIDAKYKRRIEPPLEDAIDVPGAPGSVKISAADLYQVYYYMRRLQSPQAILVLPFWDAGKGPIFKCPVGKYATTPLDAEYGTAPDHEVTVLGLNLMRPVKELFHEAVQTLGQIIDASVRSN